MESLRKNSTDKCLKKELNNSMMYLTIFPALGKQKRNRLEWLV